MSHSEFELKQLFSSTLGIPSELVTDELAYNADPRWDSTAHLQLVMAIENTFGITLEMDDMLDMSSVAKAAEILKKYGVVWN